MKILITGASGMLATDLVKCLQRDFELVGVDVRAPQVPEGSFKRFYNTGGDPIQGPKLWEKIMREQSPDIVFHAAAMTAVDRCEAEPELAEALNVKLTRDVFQAANQTGAHFVFLSTDYVFDGKKEAPYETEDLPNPKSIYGQTKADAEELVKTGAKAYTIFRISWLYGLYGDSFPRTILEKAGQAGHFDIVHDQVGRPTYTVDLSGIFCEIFKAYTANAAFKKRLKGQIYHLGNDGTASWAEFAEFILAQAGLGSTRVNRIATPPKHRPAERPKMSVMSLEKAKRDFGVNPRHWHEAAGEFVQSYQKHSGASLGKK
ncbi:MAG: dTDP-4-dehydrorhamnose reductase [Omnitrophica bacterium GWA2_52_8]|nr:MAG: dTDP-4-dehydrorhamnose reductase [Omnitrophica bacterium GWA2_52_8]